MVNGANALAIFFRLCCGCVLFFRVVFFNVVHVYQHSQFDSEMIKFEKRERKEKKKKTKNIRMKLMKINLL